MTTTPFVPCDLATILARAKENPPYIIALAAMQWLAERTRNDLPEEHKKLCQDARADVAKALNTRERTREDVERLAAELELVRAALLEALRMAYKLIPDEGVEAIELGMDLTRLSRLLPRPLAPAPTIDRRFATVGQDPAGNIIAWFRGAEDAPVQGVSDLDALASLVGVTVSHQPTGGQVVALPAPAPAAQIVRFPEVFRAAVPAYLRDTADGIDGAHDMGMPREAHESARKRIGELLAAAAELESMARWGGRERPDFFASAAYLESPHRKRLDRVVRGLLTGERHLFVGLAHNVRRPQVGLEDVGDVELRCCLDRIGEREVDGFWGSPPEPSEIR